MFPEAKADRASSELSLSSRGPLKSSASAPATPTVTAITSCAAMAPPVPVAPRNTRLATVAAATKPMAPIQLFWPTIFFLPKRLPRIWATGSPTPRASVPSWIARWGRATQPITSAAMYQVAAGTRCASWGRAMALNMPLTKRSFQRLEARRTTSRVRKSASRVDAAMMTPVRSSRNS
ncbi:MAG: hypothetical protein CVU56_21145 [Deltaproteobacteria bacterium HGW-Deltaproteobacteria-14]|nr:MAG: hypothetical protein CVU56_21145 [Deltaproteobacteria bacterium HGW-Deltaproteobacteria-14]